MNVPNDLPPHHRDYYRDGYRTGYSGDYWKLPRVEVAAHIAQLRIAMGTPGHLAYTDAIPESDPRAKAYMRGYRDGKKKYEKLKGGVGV